MTAGRRWYSVRCVFRSHAGPSWRPLDDDGVFYEERVTLWRARSFAEAIQKAEDEAVRYARDGECEYVGLAQAFSLDADLAQPTDGSEIYSLSRRSTLEPSAYLTRFFDTGAECQRDVTSGD